MWDGTFSCQSEEENVSLIPQSQLRYAAGAYVNSWTVTDQNWHLRSVDLSAWQGKTVSAVYVGVDNQSQTGAWWELIADAVIAHNDGTLVPLYNGQGSFSFGGPTVGPGMSGVSYLDRHLQNIGHTTATTTYYYHGDQIGSSRLMTSPFGEPVWNATYLPYGEEYNPEITVNNRKFTGKEHDTESGLDYFGARYYGSALGRFITPDWAAKAAAVPYAEFSDPQSLNLYTYVRNLPTTKADADGHCLEDGCVAEAAVGVTIMVMAAQAYYAMPPDQRNFGSSLSQASSSVMSTIKGWFHKDSSPPPSTTTSTTTAAPASTAVVVPNATTSQSVDKATKDKIKANAGGKCEYCGKTTRTPRETARGEAPAGDEGQTDHYKPKSKGGTDDESNLVHACRDCNGPGGKGDADPTDPNDQAGQKWKLPRMEKTQK